jgi:hypothetical protein
VLLFHGTAGPRALIEKICAEGLVPHGGRAWADRLTGVAEHVFVCTSPVGSRDGDPIRWAQRGAWKQHKAWLVVIDLPRTARELVVGAIANDELARYWSLQAFVEVAVATSLGDSRAVIAAARGRGVPVRELLVLEVASTADGLVEGTPDPATLVQFEAAYLRAGFAEKARVARSYGLRIPEWFAEDPHYGDCKGCLWNLFVVDFVAPDVIGPAGTPARFGRGTWHRLDRETLGANLDALGRWLATYDEREVARVIRRRDGIDWHALQLALPPPRDVVPPTFRPELLTEDRIELMELPDVQLLLRRVPSEHIVGALELGTAKGLSGLVRPHDGETLPDKLMFLATELRAARDRSGHPVIRRS